MPCSTIESLQRRSRAAPSELEPGTEADGWLGDFHPAFARPTEVEGEGGSTGKVKQISTAYRLQVTNMQQADGTLKREAITFVLLICSWSSAFLSARL